MKFAASLTMPTHSQTKALCLCFSILSAAIVQDVAAVSMASHLRGSVNTQARGADMSFHMDISSTDDDKDPEGIDVDVLKKELPNVTEQADCLCPLGQFWHWRLASCIQQGPWGYECGFFPMEHHHRVCQDSMKCNGKALAL